MSGEKEERTVRASQERPRHLWLTPIFWVLYAAHVVMRKTTNVVYRALRRVGYTMYDAPCPRCGESMWIGHTGCRCQLTCPVFMRMHLSALDVQTFRERDGLSVQLTVTSRSDLFHLGRGLDFHADTALESLRRDDQAAREEKRDG